MEEKRHQETRRFNIILPEIIQGAHPEYSMEGLSKRTESIENQAASGNHHNYQLRSMKSKGAEVIQDFKRGTDFYMTVKETDSSTQMEQRSAHEENHL